MAHRLFVGNLSFHTGEDALRDLFAPHHAQSVRLMTDRDTGRSRGFAFVDFADGASAGKAIEAMNGAVLDGRPLRVDAATERAPREGGFGGGGYGGGGSYGGGGYGDGGGRRDRRS